MMQTPKEVVKAAIDFTKPDRLPVMFDCYGNSDRRYLGWNQQGTGDHRRKITYDEWGCGWQRTDVKNMGQITVHPINEWRDLDAYRWPDPDDPAFFDGMEERAAGMDDSYYITTSLFMLLFERMHGLRGFENTMVDLYLERSNIEKLADRIVEFDVQMIKNIAARFPGKIDGFSFTDDWGTELALFINPDLWREFFKPRYKLIFDTVRRAGWHVWMHSCGKVNAILEDLIEIGCHVVNLQQPRALGIEDIGRRFAGRLCFEALCDIQQTLPFKGAEEIRAEAELLLECWGTENGGFIFSDYGDDAAINATPEKKRVMYDAFMENDRWRRPV
jgi:hypothetical protein